MQIFEVKNDTAEILYIPHENNLFLADFLFIDDNNGTIVSQVTNISTTQKEDINLASVKFYLSVDKNNVLTRYNGQTPSKNAPVGFLDAKEIIELFKPQSNGIVWGDYIRNPEIKIVTDMKFLSSGCVVICDRTEQKQSVVQVITESLKNSNTRFLLFDFDGKYKNVNADNELVFGRDYRIPLDSIALDYIFENDLNDCPVEAKAYIQSIILSVQKYVDSSDDGFIPFETFVNIIMSESKNYNNASLMVFGNKLLKYKQKKIFADKKEQFSAINLLSGSFKLDVSQADEKIYPLILKSIINVIKKKFYVLTDITEENSSASVLKYIYEKPNIRLLPIVNHDNCFLNKIKPNCTNCVVFAPAIKSNLDDKYGIFLDKLGNDEFIIYGENTLFIPLLVSLKSVFKNIQNEKTLNTYDEISYSDLDNLDKVNLAAVRELMVSESQNNIINPEEDTENQLLNEEETAIETDTEEPDFEKKKLDIEDASTSSVEYISEEQIPETKTNEYEQPIENQSFEDDVNVVEEHQNNYIASNNPIQQHAAEIKVVEKNIQKTVKEKESPNPDELQIYEPKEPAKNNEINFLEGDRVSHAQYGTGTVEKIINYGNKLLCSIQFDNLGRRLLDPNITILEKI